MSDPSKPTLGYSDMAESWALPRALMGGTRAMRSAGQTYLPRDPEESDSAWSARRDRSVLFNGFSHGLRMLVGKAFSKPLTYEGIAGERLDWLDDVDLCGRTIDQFARDVFADALQTGLAHILVDMPRKPESERTLEDQRRNRRRPYFVHIAAENMIGWRVETVDAKPTLTRIRFRDRVVRPDPEDQFGDILVEQIKVIEREPETGAILYRVFEESESGEWVETDAGGRMDIPEIPVATVYTGRTGFMTGVSPLEDLAWMNLQHWQSSSDQRTILHVARVPILFGKGFDGADEFVVGPNRLIKGPADSALSYVEHGGQAIASGRNDLDDIKEQMQVLSLEPLLPRTGNVTATSKVIDSASANSALEAWSTALEQAINMALGYMWQWSGGGDGGVVKANRDFGMSIGEAAELSTLIELRRMGDISRETFFSELKRRDVLSPEVTSEEEEARIDDEGDEEIDQNLSALTDRPAGGAG